MIKQIHGLVHWEREVESLKTTSPFCEYKTAFSTKGLFHVFQKQCYGWQNISETS